MTKFPRNRKRSRSAPQRKRTSPKRTSFFDPDPIATAIAQKLDRDLSTASQMYGGGTYSLRFYSEAQKVASLKKYVPFGSDTSDLEEDAFHEFLRTNDRIGEFNNSFEFPTTLSLNEVKTDDERLLVRARALMHWVLGPLWTEDWFNHCRNSAGVSQGVSFKDTSPEAKFSWPISGTRKSISLFESYLSYNRVLEDAIEELNSSDLSGQRYEEKRGSRATTVDKTVSKRRMIAIEPTLNMFFQQGLMRLMYTRMRSVGLDVARLPHRHTQLAYEGSITGQLATIDFSSASDSVSVELLRWLLPSSWFESIDRVRSPMMEVMGEHIELNMISTMGNAGTFPLESLCFWCLQVAAVMERTATSRYQLLSTVADRDCCSTFGDDCILPTTDASRFIEITQKLGFIVNKEKSFYDDEAGFRESCGGDYLHGKDVRPIYISAPTSNRLSALAPWLYTILNGLIRKYIRIFGPTKYIYEKEVFKYIFDLLRQYKLKVKLVPPYFPEDSGLRFSADLDRLHLCYDIVFDKVTQAEEGAIHFTYHRFNYRNKVKRDEYLAYALWLGQPTHDEPTLTFPTREKGGYLVARAFTTCWSLSPIKNKA